MELKKRDDTKKPITGLDSDALLYLEMFSDWLQDWREKTRSKSMKQFGLSSETFLATIQTCNALRSLACKLINEEGFSYVMLGQFHWKSALVCKDTSEEQITVSQSDKYWRQKNG